MTEVTTPPKPPESDCQRWGALARELPCPHAHPAVRMTPGGQEEGKGNLGQTTDGVC